MKDTEKLISIDYCTDKLKEAGKYWLETANDSSLNKIATAAFVEALKDGIDVDLTGTEWEAEWLANGKVCTCEACTLARGILAEKNYLSKKSQWIFGGDGWAYDIGYGGLDHVIASGKNVNILVFDTEVYSNTGGQASKATNIGAIAQFAAGGKDTKKKDLAAMAMSYGYVYVAQIAQGANMNQCIKAITEAEAYDGPSLIIAYAPCINHGIKGGLTMAQTIEKRAVESGYWNLFRFNPELADQGKSPFSLDSKEPTGDIKEFMLNEVRYSSLIRQNPERAERLFAIAEANSKAKYKHLFHLNKMYKDMYEGNE